MNVQLGPSGKITKITYVDFSTGIYYLVEITIMIACTYHLYFYLRILIAYVDG